MKSDSAFLKYPNSDTKFYNGPKALTGNFRINLFLVVCLVAWSLRENEAEGDLVLIETSLLFSCKLLLISMRTASLT